MKLDGIEDEKLCLGAEVGRVGNPSELQVALGARGDRARIKRVALFGDRVHGVGDETERRLLTERLHPEARRVRDEQHVGLVNRGPPAYAGAVEAEAVFEGVFAELVNGEG